MKSYAYYIDTATNEKKTISAFEAIALREGEPETFRLLSFFYSYDGKDYKVIPKCNARTQTAFFAFEKETDCPLSASKGETLTHYAAKQALARMKTLHLVDKKRQADITIHPASAVCEQLFSLENNYICDVYITYDKQHITPKEYFYKWDGKLALEITVTHQTETEKLQALKQNGIPVFEIRISGRIKQQMDFISKNSLENAINHMQQLFKNQIYGNLAADCETEAYQCMQKYKEEIAQFKTARDKAEQEYLAAREKADAIKKELQTLECAQRHPRLAALFHRKEK